MITNACSKGCLSACNNVSDCFRFEEGKEGEKASKGMSRVYYDSRNPRLLSDEEIARLGPRESAACCEEIDENFVAATRTVTDKLIPAVEGYGRSSKQIWDSVKVSEELHEDSVILR